MKIQAGDRVEVEIERKESDTPAGEPGSVYRTVTETATSIVQKIDGDDVFVEVEGRKLGIPAAGSTLIKTFVDREQVTEVIERSVVEILDPITAELDGEEYVAGYDYNKDVHICEDGEITIMIKDGEVTSRVSVYKNVDDRVRDKVYAKARRLVKAFEQEL